MIPGETALPQIAVERGDPDLVLLAGVVYGDEVWIGGHAGKQGKEPLAEKGPQW